jgi:hypothetical protein
VQQDGGGVAAAVDGRQAAGRAKGGDWPGGGTRGGGEDGMCGVGQ